MLILRLIKTRTTTIATVVTTNGNNEGVVARLQTLLAMPVEVVFSRLRLPDLRCRTTLLPKAFGGYGLRLSVIPLPFCSVLVT